MVPGAPQPQQQQHPPLCATRSSPTLTPQPLPPSPTPTAAARQLDELLADLGQMQSKVSPAPGTKRDMGSPEPIPHPPLSRQLAATGQGEGAPGGPEPSLDHMLGGLTRDLQELGITATPTGLCASCCKPIAGKVSPKAPSPALRPPREGAPSPAPTPQVLTALGKAWHPEHFTCARCGQELGGQPFFERGGQAYCEEDYHQAFSPRCAYCAGPIREVRSPLPQNPPTCTPPHPGASFHLSPQKVLTAMDQTWHPEHFFCTHCGKVFGDDGLFWRGCGAPSPLPPPQPCLGPFPSSPPSPGTPWPLSQALELIPAPSPQVSTSGRGSPTAARTS